MGVKVMVGCNGGESLGGGWGSRGGGGQGGGGGMGWVDEILKVVGSRGRGLG